MEKYTLTMRTPFLLSFGVSHFELIRLCAAQCHFKIDLDHAVGLTQIASNGSFQPKVV